MWEADTGEVAAMLEGHSGPVYHVRFLPDGTVVSAGRDGTLRRWDIDHEKQLAEEKAHGRGVYALAASRDGTRLATGGGDGVLMLWDAATFKPLWRAAPPPPAPRPGAPPPRADRAPTVWRVAFGHDGAAPGAAAVKVYSLSFHGVVQEWDAATGERLRELEPAGAATALAVAPGGATALVASDEGPRLWALDGMKLVAPLLPRDYTHDLAVSPDGRFAALGRGGFQSARGWIRAQDPRVPIWDLSPVTPPGGK